MRHLYEDLTVAENLDFYAGVYSLKGEEAREQKSRVTKRMGLEGRLGQLVGSLSRGWKQRVALACFLLHNPRLLVLDEPTAGVDPVSRRVFWETIRQLSQEGMTVLVSTHYMDEAESCDYLGVVFYGHLIAFGTPQEMKVREGKTNLDDLFIEYVGSGSLTALPVNVETRVWYNPDMKSTVFNIPALIGLILQNVIAMLTSFSMVREKERGTSGDALPLAGYPSFMHLCRASCCPVGDEV